MNKEQTHIPEKIKKIIGETDFDIDEVGMSDSKVLIFQDYVLKIQNHSAETDNENNICKLLNDKIKIPKILVYCVENEIAYTLMTKVKGEMLCDKKYLSNPNILIEIVANGLKMMWEVNTLEIPDSISSLDERLKEARRNVEQGTVDIENVQPETFGKDGFANPEELIEWLEHNKPEEDIVLSHGDFCLPNILANGGEISGFIDLGKMGKADRWQDLAIVLRSLKHNFEGKYFEGKVFCDFSPEMLLDKLGISMNEEKNRYYMLLDELF